jgi:FAD:protein FMN transferase
MGRCVRRGDVRRDGRGHCRRHEHLIGVVEHHGERPRKDDDHHSDHDREDHDHADDDHDRSDDDDHSDDDRPDHLPLQRGHLGRDHEPVVMSTVAPPNTESVESFPCFGGRCTVLVQGTGPAGSAPEAVAHVKRRLREWHDEFSRFNPESELCRLNRDPRPQVPVSAVMTRFVEAALYAARLTGGLVDPTLVREVEAAGYAEHFRTASVPLHELVTAAPARKPAGPHPAARWRGLSVDRRAGTVTRPPGVRLDSGGIAKGLFGDVLAAVLNRHESFAIAVAGDVRFGGVAGQIRPVQVADPFQAERVLHTFDLVSGAAATSGTSHRSWIGPDGKLAHHLLNPATGQPAFTGLVQVTALAPTGVEAEALAKAALLSGPAHAAEWLCHGGVIVGEDGGYEVFDPPATEVTP